MSQVWGNIMGTQATQDSEVRTASQGQHDQPSSQATDDIVERTRTLQKHGPVLAIGGAEDKGPSADILARFVEVAGGKRARIAVIPTASSEAEEAGDEYTKVFRKLGVSDVGVVDVKQREDATKDSVLQLIRDATGIFVTGGDQGRLVELLIGTPVMDSVRLRNREGVIVAGTSAGASVVAAHMLLGGTGMAGDSSDASARKAMVEVVAGFCLLPDVIIDQHFSQRGRMGRLLSAFAANPGLVGIGLDENTAVLVADGGVLETLGEGMVTIVNGREVVSDYFNREPGEVLTLTNCSLHVLGPGHHFDLVTHQLTDQITA
jgi:cyanophycinase